jgi:hypothetical protein
MDSLARMKTRFGALVASLTTAVGVGLLLAPAASADSTDSVVAGTAGAELSLAVATPSVMTLTHATPATSTSLVTVTSTNASWTLTVADSSSAGTPGHMQYTGGGSPAVTELANPLQWKGGDQATFTDLTGTDATVKTGSLVDAFTVTYQQALGATEAVQATDPYSLTATYTVN